jgi:hypothetical protein
VEIINTAFRLRTAACVTSALVLGSTSIFAGDLVLHKVPSAQAAAGAAAGTGKRSQDNSATFGLVTYSLKSNAKARALYVSSGGDLAQANNMLDEQPGTAYSFATDDASPTTVLDLGKPSTLRRLSAVYSPRAGKMDFYVLQGMPNGAVEGTPDDVTLDEATLAKMKVVGSVTDDGTRGQATVEFPATAGRYVMVRWIPAAQQDASFTLAEIAANETGSTARLESDGKTMLDGKTMIDTKDMPAEAPQSPAEGPPPTLPQPPPFTFVPVLVPVSE